uniref:The Golgi pH Regulator (GPHR) Family N-terminal n=1 Tax=Siphoviridae sp. ctCVD13 TaxID=2826194 RepID=A0A8S5MFP6_9CAUD|nr:MAG TPA: The Golgi pH Regulator (GPHR) Family N-terminal [Siphoviridae sp. ctCVD13]
MSAVVGIILLGLVCGVGTVAMTQLLRVPTAELDHLYCCGT